MPTSKLVRVSESKFETELDRMTSKKVKKIINAMFNAEADEVAKAAHDEFSGRRKTYHTSYYEEV
ncbi:hypothetical protein OZX57_01760 [Bifidobacterium sp. ESL0682]|uniref:hypothetical protein n=1 Tax=Bifidobacterium sp. ESL0682 TaxID=2983212 RepID=UPI0023F9114B|nr:hypothetical protein [Bifidobacterium sp. ESL0682]WEV42242.1 hypothetical protein OZX57_01760 [Bifidobacterium sp. ESL0682]